MNLAIKIISSYMFLSMIAGCAIGAADFLFGFSHNVWLIGFLVFPPLAILLVGTVGFTLIGIWMD